MNNESVLLALYTIIVTKSLLNSLIILLPTAHPPLPHPPHHQTRPDYSIPSPLRSIPLLPPLLHPPLLRLQGHRVELEGLQGQIPGLVMDR